MRSDLLRWAVLALSLTVCACAGAPDAIIGVGSGVPVRTATPHQIMVATTRAPADDPAIFFSGERGTELSFASVIVSVPPGHRIGRIERPQSLPPDPRTEFAVTDAVRFDDRTSFGHELTRALQQRPPSERTVLLFVHGYNTSFTSAVLQATQFVHDSGFKGVPVLFSWASRGGTFDYFYDLNSAALARDALIETAVIVGRETPSTRSYDIVAHSMGNFLTVEAMRQAAIEGRFNRSGKIRSIILASPDIDVDLFAHQLAAFSPEERRFYVFVSEDDKALGVSKWLAGGVNRVGDEDVSQLAELGVVVIDLSRLRAGDAFNHGKFADSPDAVRLIGQTLLAGGRLDEESQPSLKRLITVTAFD